MSNVDISSQQSENEFRWFGADKEKYSTSTEYNVLHDYRSYNYVFTLGVLTKEQYNDPSFFQRRNGDIDYVILKSSGKGVREITGTALTVDEISSEASSDREQLIADFNATGYGRFDFFIENIEIETVWNLTDGAQPAKVRFDVVEPFSINGFIESYRVNAIAAGYEDYKQAVCCLKIEFIGYKDGDGLPKPEVIPNSTRFFPININGMTLETTERGTVYKVAATPKNSMGYGDDGKLATTVKMKGTNVEEVLQSLMEQVEESRKKDAGEDSKFYNEYKIEFEDNKKSSGITADKLKKSKINDELRSNQVMAFPDISDNTGKNSYKSPTPPTKINYDPNKETITFHSQASIVDAITAVIRESKYSEELTTDKVKEYIKNNNGLVPWFRVYLKSEIKPGGENPKTGQLNYIYTYKVIPFLVHFSKLPNYARSLFDAEDIKGTIKRSYNYLYTGKNIDILNFNLRFNQLFFQQRPYRMGNRDDSAIGQSAVAPNTVELKAPDQPSDSENKEASNIPSRVSVENAGMTVPGGLGKAPQSTPYFKLGQVLHQTLLDTNDLNVVDLSIVGDPYYLVTANIGNQEEELADDGVTVDGAAPYLGGQVYINLNFRTPKDIKQDGFADFGEGLLPFSGVFYVNKVINTFRDGKFEQRLNAIRLAGQLVNEKGENIVASVISTPKPGEQKTTDTAPSSVSQVGARPTDANLLNMLSRGLPTIGLPGLLSNFSNAVGGALGGVNTALQTTLQRVDQAVSATLAPVNGVLQQAQSALNVAAQVGGLVAAGQALINGFDNPGGAPGLGQNVRGYNPYSSGIRLNTNGLNDIALGNSQNDQSNIVAQSRIVSSFIQDTSNLRVLNQNYNNNVISNRLPSSDSRISGVGNKVDELNNGTPVDPKALAAKLGIDPSQLSGLSGNQQSNILSQLIALANTIPENTDIAGLKALGVSMSNIYGASIKNLPALQPLTTAPLANIPVIDLNKILAGGGSPANLPGALAVPGVAAFLALLNKEKNIPNNGVAGGVGSLNSTSVLDKLETAQNMSNNIRGSANFSNADIGLGSVESNSAANNQRVQGYGGFYVISKTAFAQYGTRRQDSPIDKLMQTKV